MIESTRTRGACASGSGPRWRSWRRRGNGCGARTHSTELFSNAITFCAFSLLPRRLSQRVSASSARRLIRSFSLAARQILLFCAPLNLVPPPTQRPLVQYSCILTLGGGASQRRTKRSNVPSRCRKRDANYGWNGAEPTAPPLPQCGCVHVMLCCAHNAFS